MKFDKICLTVVKSNVVPLLLRIGLFEHCFSLLDIISNILVSHRMAHYSVTYWVQSQSTPILGWLQDNQGYIFVSPSESSYGEAEF